MSADLAPIRAIESVPNVGRGAEPARPAAARLAASRPPAEPMPAARPPTPPTAAEGPSMVPNPTLRLDHALSVVVIEFRDWAGQVSWTIPSERELAAYRAAAARAGDATPGGTPPDAAPAA